MGLKVTREITTYNLGGNPNAVEGIEFQGNKKRKFVKIGKKMTYTTDWILATGKWNDEGRWDDNAVMFG